VNSLRKLLKQRLTNVQLFDTLTSTTWIQGYRPSTILAALTTWPPNLNLLRAFNNRWEKLLFQFEY